MIDLPYCQLVVNIASLHLDLILIMKKIKESTASTSTTSTSTTSTSTSTSTTTSTVVKEWTEALVTKDDPFHVHKTLGMACLASFAWRMRLAYQNQQVYDMGFASHPSWTIPTLALHLSLNLSSFEFHNLPARRIKTGYRIWKEYRIHSLVFLCRSLAFMAMTCYEITYDVKPNHWRNLFIVLATVLAADVGSYIVVDHTSGFARQLAVPNAVKFFFSASQFLATTYCLYGTTHRRFSNHFVFCMIVQLNALLMTIRRKNLARHYVLVSLYGVMLVAGCIICHTELVMSGWSAFWICHICACVAIVMRLGPQLPALRWLQSKYVVWPCVSMLMRDLLPILDNNENKESSSATSSTALLLVESQLRPVALVASVGALAVGYYKCNYGYQQEKSVKKL